MNILLIYPAPFVEGKDSFYYFYKQLTDWLTEKGIASQLHFAYLRKKKEDIVRGIQLPDPNKYNTNRNAEALAEYVIKNHINVLFNFNNIITSIYFLFDNLKQKCPGIKIINLIHSCPNHIVQLKKIQFEKTHFFICENSIKDRFLKRIPRFYLWLLNKKIQNESRKEYRLYDATVVLSPSYIPEYRSLVGYSNTDNIFAIPNPLPPEGFYPTIINPQEKQKEIVFVGRFSKEKAIPLLLRIWRKVQDQIPDWKLILIGDGEYMPHCCKLADSLQLQNVEFRGLQDARPFINRASILCLTSVIEGLPTVFTEAMTMGVIPIGFGSFSAIYDMIDHWGSGIIIPAFEEEKYADALVELASNNPLRYEMAKAAQMKVKQYDISVIAPMWMNVFNQLRIL